MRVSESVNGKYEREDEGEGEGEGGRVNGFCPVSGNSVC